MPLAQNENIDQTSKDVPASAKELQDQLKAKANEAVDYVSAEARKAMDDPRAYAADAQERIANYTRQEPMKALAIAAGIAFVLGALRRR